MVPRFKTMTLEEEYRIQRLRERIQEAMPERLLFLMILPDNIVELLQASRITISEVA